MKADVLAYYATENTFFYEYNIHYKEMKNIKNK